MSSLGNAGHGGEAAVYQHINVCVFLPRNQVKSEYLMSLESSDSLLEEIGAQALNTAAYQLPEAVLQAVDAVTHDDVIMVSVFFLLLFFMPYTLPVLDQIT